MLRFRAPIIIVLAVVPGLVPRLSAAEDLPSGPITLIVSSSAGGITDTTSRLYADVLGHNLGRFVVVENRPAGGGAAAAMGVKNAAPDGRTLLVYPGTQLAALPALQHVPYDPVTDFEPIATLFDLLNFVAVPPDRPANTNSADFSARLRTSTASSFPSTTDYRSQWCSTVARFR